MRVVEFETTKIFKRLRMYTTIFCASTGNAYFFSLLSRGGGRPPGPPPPGYAPDYHQNLVVIIPWSVCQLSTEFCQNR